MRGQLKTTDVEAYLLALTSLEALLGLVDDIDAAFTTNHLVIAVAGDKRLK